MDSGRSSARLEGLLSLPFLLSLGALLINDLFLKAAYPNWITGKLSDFSGIFLVSSFLFMMLPSYIRLTGFLVAFFFVIWKSSFSQPLIHAVQWLGIHQFGRVVDYSDCIVLIMIPLAALLVKNRKHRASVYITSQRAIGIPVLILSLFAVMGTSVANLHQNFTIRQVDPTVDIELEELVTAVDEVAQKHGLKGTRECSTSLSGEYFGEDLRMYYKIDPERGSINFSISGIPRGLFFTKHPHEKMETLKKSLMHELGHRFKDMEFVIPLSPK